MCAEVTLRLYGPDPGGTPRRLIYALRQLAGFTAKLGTAEPFGLTCMSATVPVGLLETVDRPLVGETIKILSSERSGELAVRLGASRTIRRLTANPAARTRHKRSAP